MWQYIFYSLGDPLAIIRHFKNYFVSFYALVRLVKRLVDFNRRNVKVARGSYIASGVIIGKCTRINNPSYIADCEIGAFCAIGGRLVVRSTNHCTNTINMQDWAQKNVIKSRVKVAGFSKGRVSIGNGVWIGDSVIILPGVSIGNGAVIGAGSVVTRPVPSYAIAVGNPARVLRYRFTEEVIRCIEDIDWWNWSYKKIRENRSFFEIDFAEIEPSTINEKLKELGIK